MQDRDKTFEIVLVKEGFREFHSARFLLNSFSWLFQPFLRAVLCVYMLVCCVRVYLCVRTGRNVELFLGGGGVTVYLEAIFRRVYFSGAIFRGGDFPRIILKNIIILPNCTLCFLVAHCFSDNSSGNKRKCYSMFWKQTRMLLYVMKM